MADKTFIVNLPVDQARSLISQIFTQDGWKAEPTPTGGLALSKGKMGLSIAVGSLAGKNFYLSQSVDFATGPQGETVVVYRSSTGSAIIGGAVGVSKSNTAHAFYSHAISQTLEASGALLAVQ